jgi:hypothetical protein
LRCQQGNPRHFSTVALAILFIHDIVYALD